MLYGCDIFSSEFLRFLSKRSNLFHLCSVERTYTRGFYQMFQNCQKNEPVAVFATFWVQRGYIVVFRKIRQENTTPPQNDQNWRSIFWNCGHPGGKPTSSQICLRQNCPPIRTWRSQIFNKFTPVCTMFGPQTMTRSLRRLLWCPCAPWNKPSAGLKFCIFHLILLFLLLPW